MSVQRLAVVGVGHLGKEHARILAQMPEVDLVGMVDDRSILRIDKNLELERGIAILNRDLRAPRKAQEVGAKRV